MEQRCSCGNKQRVHVWTCEVCLSIDAWLLLACTCAPGTHTPALPLPQKHNATAVAGVSGKRTKKHQRKVGAAGWVVGDPLPLGWSAAGKYTRPVAARC